MDDLAREHGLYLLDAFLDEVLDDPAFELGDNAEDWPGYCALAAALGVDDLLQRAVDSRRGKAFEGSEGKRLSEFIARHHPA